MSKFVEKFLLTNGKKQSKIEKQTEVRKIKNISVQQWLPLEEILNTGIIKVNKNKYVKILKIIPINYNLKSDLYEIIKEQQKGAIATLASMELEPAMFGALCEILTAEK